jgi:hypothetical protein
VRKHQAAGKQRNDSSSHCSCHEVSPCRGGAAQRWRCAAHRRDQSCADLFPFAERYDETANFSGSSATRCQHSRHGPLHQLHRWKASRSVLIRFRAQDIAAKRNAHDANIITPLPLSRPSHFNLNILARMCERRLLHEGEETIGGKHSQGGLQLTGDRYERAGHSLGRRLHGSPDHTA